MGTRLGNPRNGRQPFNRSHVLLAFDEISECEGFKTPEAVLYSRDDTVEECLRRALWPEFHAKPSKTHICRSASAGDRVADDAIHIERFALL